MKGRVKVTLIPLGNKIKYFIRGSRLWCNEMKNEIIRSSTLNKDDLIFVRIFNSELEKNKFLNKGKSITIITTLSKLGYSRCDSSGNHGSHIRKYE